MKKIIGLSFPQWDTWVFTSRQRVNNGRFFRNGTKNFNTSYSFPNLMMGVLPQGDNVYYVNDNSELKNIDDNDVEYYLVSLSYYTEEFKEWAKTVTKEKIIIGGYHGSFYDFDREELLQYANKIIIGSCDDIFNTIQQPGDVVEGIINFKNLPRYDLLGKPSDIFTIQTATVIGCPHSCNFCLGKQASLGKIHIKPIEYLKKEMDIIKKSVNFDQYQHKFGLADANFLLNPNWENVLQLFYNPYRKIGFSTSFDLCTEEKIKKIKQYNGLLVLGLENLMDYYKKTENSMEILKLFNDVKVECILNFIIDIYAMQDKEYFDEYFNRLDNILKIGNPVMIKIFKLGVQYKTDVYEKYKKHFNIIKDDISIDTEQYITDKEIFNKIQQKIDEILLKYPNIIC